jgi:hypothetical protein
MIPRRWRAYVCAFHFLREIMLYHGCVCCSLYTHLAKENQPAGRRFAQHGRARRLGGAVRAVDQ